MLQSITSGNKLKIASNTIYQLIGKVFSMAITVLGTVIITRTYGLSGYGEFSLMQIWPALFFIIVDFGINAIATRELSKDFSKAGEYFGNILLIRVVLALFFVVLLNIVLFIPGLSSLYSQGLILGIRLSLFLILLHALTTSANIIFQTKLRYDLSTISLVFGYVVILVWLLVTTKLKLPVEWVNFGYVIGGIVTFVSSYVFVLRLGVKVTFKVKSTLWKYLFVQSLPLGVMFVFSQLNFREDAILLSILKLPREFGLDNTQSAGIYNLPYKIFEVSLVIPTFFMNAVYPVMVQKFEEGREALKSVLKKTMYLLFAGGVLSALVGVIFSKWVINLLGGAEFSQSVLVLQILLGGLVFYYLTSPLSWLLLTLEKQKVLPFIYLFVAILNLALNLIFIPRYSFYAAAVLTHVSELLVLIILGYAALKYWKEHYAKVSI